MAVAEDKIVRTRLQIDGEGNGDDRRLTVMAKQVTLPSKETLPFDILMSSSNPDSQS